ncbi:MAG TPA: hypothetical protein VM123_13110 [archaeon]|nr:hypothetical protein [archaeon]
MKLNVKAFSFTCAIFLGLGMFLYTWWVIAFEGPIAEVSPLSYGYRGYCISPLGSVIGLGYGLVEGLIGGAVFAWLYNKLICEPKEKAEAPKEPAK